MIYKPFKDLMKERILNIVRVQEELFPTYSFARAKFKRDMKIVFNDPLMFDKLNINK